MTTHCLDRLKSLSRSHDQMNAAQFAAADIGQMIFEDGVDPTLALKRTDELIHAVWTGFSRSSFRNVVLDKLEMIRREVEIEVDIAKSRPSESRSCESRPSERKPNENKQSESRAAS